MASGTLGAFVPFLVLMGLLQGALSQSPRTCGVYEERSSRSLTCSITRTTQPFDSFGPRLEINGEFQLQGYCDSNGQCISDDPSRYTMSYFYDTNTTSTNVTLHVAEIHRNMTRLRCYRDDSPLLECYMVIYVRPSKPTCGAPEFVTGGTAALFTCTSERVYPQGACIFTPKAGNPDLSQQPYVVATTNVDSEDYPGDQHLTCTLQVPVTGSPEGDYRYSLSVLPNVGQSQSSLPTSSVSTDDTLLPLRLRRTALHNPANTGYAFAFPESGELTMEIQVTGSPEPNRFSLSVSPDDPSSPTPLPSQDYRMDYTPSAAAGAGVIQLLVTAGFQRGRSSFFTFKADNGVVGGSELEYTFSILREYLQPSEPTCQGPDFVDGGTAALISCTSDRVFPSATCNFELMDGSTIMSEHLHTTTTNTDSERFPGDKEVTCQLRVAVAGNTAGDYRFQVEITPDLPGLPTSATVTGGPLPSLSLRRTGLYNPDDTTGHVFEFPDTGELALEIQVTGNPEPNRVSLSVRRSGTSSSVSLSSQDYRWTYARTVGSLGGVLQLTLTGGSSSRAGYSGVYTLQANNGVLGTTALEYTFTINGPETEEEDNDDDNDNSNLALIVGVAASGVVVVIIALAVVLFLVVRRGKCQQTRNNNTDYDAPNRPETGGYIYPNLTFTSDQGATGSNGLEPPPYEDNRKSSGSNVYCEPFDRPAPLDQVP